MASGNICIIGPMRSGKTTYLSALIYHGEHSKGRKKFRVIPKNPESQMLADQAQDILLKGAGFQSTERKSVDELPLYSFVIETKNSWNASSKAFQLTARDYPGEFFEKIAKPSQSDSLQKDFINECFTDVIGCLILLTGWEPGQDNFYNRVMKQFIILMDARGRSQDLKLAIVMSKCERGEIWPGRLDPETDLFGVHLKQTRKTLREGIIPQNLRFFALSTFGVLNSRTNPRPNREDRITKGDEPASVLREPQHWKPYNLIEPLYWLSQKPKARQKS